MAEDKKDFKHIVRIANTDLDGKKPILHAMKKIKGVSFMFSNMVCNLTGIDKHKTTGELSGEEEKKLNDFLEDPVKHSVPSWMLNRRRDLATGADMHIVGADLKYQTQNDIKLMKKIKCYKGVRHSAGLPARGQRTKSNFRKNKGKAQSVKRKAGKGKK